VKLYNPNQIVLFPDLFDDIPLPSITTLPDFDHALSNFVKLADFGAFIDLNFSGLEKSYSLKLSDLKIPAGLLTATDNGSPVFQLFPLKIHKGLKRLKYETRAFFTKRNSFRTHFGYFLLRQYFHRWDVHRKDMQAAIIRFVNDEIGPDAYQRYFEKIWLSGCHWLAAQLQASHPYELPGFNLPHQQTIRNEILTTEATLSSLDPESPNYLVLALALKTLHIPLRCEDYQGGIVISSTFKTIHLEYLKDTTIETLDDIKALFEKQ